MASASCSPCGALASPEPGRKILPRMISHSELRKLFYSADAVCFDVDSTVISEEGIGRSLALSPGWSAMVQSRLTATSASWVQAILLPPPPE
ncbi:hypothetical protein CK820_G0044395 [Pan troglodytes]|uniref:Phosphoserine phosphatase n=2 Tax=Pan troglodytes TaxID=9598 RepID=A0A2J8JU15_PANTR|nr:hypothetical protein CK820_G0044395 [Pan troglodytes]